MIDYSKVLRQNPINPNAPKKTYAQVQRRETLDINKLCQHMAEHGSPFTRGTIKAVMTDAIDHIKELLLDGNQIQLGDLGKFYVVLLSKGVCESVEDRQTGLKPVFTAENITTVRTKWEPSEEMKNLRSQATFNLVPTRLEQAKAAKEKNDAIAEGTYVPLGGKDGKDGITEVD